MVRHISVFVCLFCFFLFCFFHITKGAFNWKHKYKCSNPVTTYINWFLGCWTCVHSLMNMPILSYGTLIPFCTYCWSHMAGLSFWTCRKTYLGKHSIHKTTIYLNVYVTVFITSTLIEHFCLDLYILYLYLYRTGAGIELVQVYLLHMVTARKVNYHHKKVDLGF